MSRRVLANLIVFGLIFVTMTVWAVNNLVSVKRLEQPYPVRGIFAASAGVAKNSEVTYLGVHLGTVSKVELIDNNVEITMQINRNRKVPAQAVARVFRKSAVGEPYIDFVPPDDFDPDHATYLEKNDLIPLERTTIPLEFSELLKSLNRVVQGIDADDASTLVHELAVAIEGRSDSLRQLTISTNHLLESFAQRSDQLDRLIKNNTRLTSVFSSHRASLATSIVNLRALAATLRDADGDTRVLLDRGSQLVGRVADVVGSQKANLDCLLHDLDDVVTMLGSDRQIDNLEKVLTDGPRGFNYVYATRDTEPEGAWVRVNLLTNFDEPPDQYVPPRELPDVPTVPACVSTLRSSGVVVGTAAGGATATTLPVTDGRRPWAAAGIFLAAGAVATLITRRQLRDER